MKLIGCVASYRCWGKLPARLLLDINDILQGSWIRQQMGQINVLKVLRDQDHQLPITKSMPSQVNENCLILLDMNGKELEDVEADGNGQYKNDGTYHWNFDDHYKKLRPKYRGMVNAESLSKTTYVVTKKYFIHKTYHDFKRLICYVSNSRSLFCNNLVLIAYIFDNEAHPITLLPHGNSRSQVGYTKRKRSIVKAVATEAQNTSIGEALERHVIQNGGRANIAPEINPPANQLSKFNNRKPVSLEENEFGVMMQWARANNLICRSINAHPEPFIVIATDQNFVDLRRFAVGAGSMPITVDPTFDLGNFYVTPVSFRNTFIENRQGSSGVFCGPLMIHYKKTRHSYYQLFRVMNECVPELENLHFYGTDGENELIRALEQAYPDAQGLRCFRHMEGALKEKLKALKLVHLHATLIDQIKLILLENYANFDAEYKSLSNSYGNQNKSLCHYLLTNQNNFSRTVYNGELFYTNSSESVNFKISKFMGQKKLPLYVFLEKISLFLSHEEGKVDDAYVGLSQTYKLRAEYRHIFPCGNYNALSKKDKKEIMENFKTISVEAACITKPVTLPSSNHIAHDFGVPPEKCNINVPSDILVSMYIKASRTLTNNKIMEAPGAQDLNIYSCASETTTGLNYHVKVYIRNGKVECSCKNYKIYTMCSHAVAAAHLDDCFFRFIHWHRANVKRGLPINVFTQSVNTARSGMKDHAKTRVRHSNPKKRQKYNCQFDHDEEGVVKLVDLKVHTTVKTCNKCHKKDLPHVKYEGWALSKKMYRSFIHPVRRTPTLSFNKEWVYFHVNKNCVAEEFIHVCTGFPQGGIDWIEQHGYKAV